MPLTFSRPIPHCNSRLHTTLTPPRFWPLCPTGLSIGTLNIRDGQGFGLAKAIWAVEHGGFEVMVLTKTKISTLAYCWNRIGYKVTCLTARPTSSRGS